LSSPKPPLDKWHHSLAPSPSIPFHKQNYERSKISDFAPSFSYTTFAPFLKQQGVKFLEIHLHSGNDKF